MPRFDSPGWRIAGSVVSWAAFAFFFLGLFQSAGVVMGLGGYCASGGPYVIETECPEAVIVFAPLGVFGMFFAAGVAFAVARGFGVSLIAWAWPILFVGLGIQFLASAASGESVISNLSIGLLFVAMGVAPVVVFVRAKAIVPTLVGSRGLSGDRFAYDGTPRPSVGLTPTEGSEVAPSARDWATSLGLWVVAAGGGAWLSLLAFAALSSAG